MEGRGEMRIASCNDVVCPKPRRFLTNDNLWPSKLYNTICQDEISESREGMELLDLILSKGGYGAEESNTQLACSPPFFIGSPPGRASNPLIQDSQFRSNESRPFLATPQSPSARKGGSCGRVSHTPATVRIEGFDCLSGDCRSISAFA